MGGMTRNYGNIKTLVADTVTATTITNSDSTSTTSVTILTGISSFSSATSTITYTKQTVYYSGGVLQNFSTVTTTSVSST